MARLTHVLPEAVLPWSVYQLRRAPYLSIQSQPAPGREPWRRWAAAFPDRAGREWTGQRRGVHFAIPREQDWLAHSSLTTPRNGLLRAFSPRSHPGAIRQEAAADKLRAHRWQDRVAKAD